MIRKNLIPNPNAFFFLNGDGNNKDTLDLYDSIIRRWCEIQGFHHEYFNLDTIESTEQALRGIAIRTKNNSLTPLIYISAHGSKENIKLNNGDHYPFNKLIRDLQAINIGCANTLCLVMSTCYGSFLSVLFADCLDDLEKSRSPACLIIGPSKTITYEESRKGFFSFFENLLQSSSKDWKSAIEGLEIMSEYNGVFGRETSEKNFRQLMKMYEEQHLNKEYILKRISQDKERYSNDSSIYWPVFKFKCLETRLEKQFHIKYIRKVYNSFFMLDCWPKMKYRYPEITFETDFESLKAEITKEL